MDMYSTSLTDLKEQMLQGLKLMITSHFSMVYDDMVRRIESNLKYRETKLLQQQQQELKGQDTAEIFKVLQQERDHFKDVCLRLESKIENTSGQVLPMLMSNLQNLLASFQESKDSVKDLQTTVEEKQRIIENLKKLLENKHETIEELEEKLESKNETMQGTTERLKDEEQWENLRNEKKELQLKINELEETVKEKDGIIKRQQQKIETLEKFPVKREDLHYKMSLKASDPAAGGWKETTKNVQLRNCILDSLTFRRIDFKHSVDFTGSSLVNVKFDDCWFQDRSIYSFDRCDLRNCTFDWCRCKNDAVGWSQEKLVEMVKYKKITFHNVKNIDQVKFTYEPLKRAIKETYNL